MSAVRIKKGDTVKVIAGKDKGKTGKVMSVNAKNHTALVEGVNMVTKHAKPSAANQQGGILHQEAPIDISNIAYSLKGKDCLLYTSPSPRDRQKSRMPSSA